MKELKEWLRQSEKEPAEEMTEFFGARLGGYEEHMQIWRQAYEQMAEFVCRSGVKRVLDLGCGTGLEIDEILSRDPSVTITGIDLSADMLQKLQEKHPKVQTSCADYFAADFGSVPYDMVISVESFHHFPAEQKQRLFAKILCALKPDGVFLEADYLACCDEEETLLGEMCRRKRLRDRIPEAQFVHIDTPLTAEHELAALDAAGFSSAELIGCIQGAVFVRATR